MSTSISEKARVTVHALSAGHFTLPEYQFIHPVSYEARKTVPSLAFLIQHQNVHNGKITRIVFDLGLRRDIKRYATPIQKHAETRQPMTTNPDVVKSLARGGLQPKDIDYVFYSHVHWDHIGEPRDFPTSTFVVGNGALSLLNGTLPSLRGSHSFFEPDLLPSDRTIELSAPATTSTPTSPPPPRSKLKDHSPNPALSFHRPWKPHPPLHAVMDIFSDDSVLIVDAPGHLSGHINLLVRVSASHRIYLGGDSCHDRRLLTGEKAIGEWHDTEGHACCIHADRKKAEETIQRIRALEQEGVEVIFAHDVEWEADGANVGRFFGAEGR